MQERARFRNVKPIMAPTSLDELRGPLSGNVRLPLEGRWARDDDAYDVGTRAGASVIYQTVLAGNSVEHPREYLNRDRHIKTWHDLDRRIIDLWQARSPNEPHNHPWTLLLDDQE